MPASTGFQHGHRSDNVRSRRPRPSDPRLRGRAPEASLVLTGSCEVSLLRAVLPYEDLDRPTGERSIEDLGLGVVLDSEDPESATLLDLGSGQTRRANLTGPLVVFGWLYPGTVEDLVDQAARRGVSPEDGSAGWWHRALRLLHRTGFSDLTRPLFQRAGFRDLVEDIDLHQALAVRIALPGGVARIRIDCERSLLVVQTGSSERDPAFESVLCEAFPLWPIDRGVPEAGVGTQVYQVAIPIARSLRDLRLELRAVRRGILDLLRRFEPARHRAIQEAVEGFGERDLLAAFVEPGAHAPARTSPRESAARDLGATIRPGLAAPTSARVH